MVDPELVAIGAEAPARLTDLGVMPEPGGEGEEPQPDAGAQARECAGAVALEAELSLAGPKTDSMAAGSSRAAARGWRQGGQRCSRVRCSSSSAAAATADRSGHTATAPAAATRDGSN